MEKCFSVHPLSIPHDVLVAIHSSHHESMKGSNSVYLFIYLFIISLYTYIYLWSKVVCLFCFCTYDFHRTQPGCFRLCSWSLWKALKEEGCIGLVSWHLDLWCRSSWILNDSSLKIKLNYIVAENFGGIGVYVPLVLLERSWWASWINGILFGKIWIRNVGAIDSKLISAIENSNKFQKTRFWKEKSVENVVTLGPTAQATLWVQWWC